MTGLIGWNRAVQTMVVAFWCCGWAPSAWTPSACAASVPALAQAGLSDWSAGHVFACDAPSGHICFFSIVDAAGRSLLGFSLQGGERKPVLLPVQGGHSYTVTVDRDFTHDYSCRSAATAGLFCKHRTVTPGTNN